MVPANKKRLRKKIAVAGVKRPPNIMAGKVVFCFPVNKGKTKRERKKKTGPKSTRGEKEGGLAKRHDVGRREGRGGGILFISYLSGRGG